MNPNAFARVINLCYFDSVQLHKLVLFHVSVGGNLLPSGVLLGGISMIKFIKKPKTPDPPNPLETRICSIKL